ncbi:MAG: GNAT family N-acetyltransferase [Actinomycetota bacterium]|nr:GNAT family N-acetyltransferase [Euzebyaceae bacterium]MDQ3452889.1 GNAT family N-acetyltransferase [Actinomycetota bacterium]
MTGLPAPPAMPAMPAMPALRWRAPTRDDVPAWQRLLAAVDAIEGQGEVPDDEELADEFDTAWTDPRRDALFGFDDNGSLLAFGWVQCTPGAVQLHRVRLWGDVHPEWRRRGLGRFLLAWLQARGQQIAADLPPNLPAVLEVAAEIALGDRIRLFERTGFVPVRWFSKMQRDLRAATAAHVALPAGISIRPWSPDDDETTRIAHNLAFAGHWGTTSVEAQAWRHSYTGAGHFRPDLSLLAYDGEQLAGYCLGSHYLQDTACKGYSEGWIDRLGTLPAFRRRGVGTALLGAALGAIADAGLDVASLMVDTGNASGALALYERLGFTPVERIVVLHKALPRAAAG